jgi:hypothetical protein
MKSAIPTTTPSSKGNFKQVFVGNKRNIDVLKAHEQKLLNDLRQAHLLGKNKRADYLQRQYLKSFAARYVATETAYKSMKNDQRPPKPSLTEIAEELNAFRGTDEIVEVFWKPKKSNSCEFRPIMQFGIRNKALQYLVAASLKARANIHPMQFAINCGRQAAVKQAIQLMQNGNVYVSEMDIVDCFPSFDGEKLTKVLLLPKEVIERVVLSSHFNVFPIDLTSQSWDSVGELYDFYSEYLTEAQRGIAQGSATSSVVAEVLLSSVFAQLPNVGTVLSYADNFLLLTQSSEEAASIRKALRCVLQVHPVGPLKLKAPKIYEPGQAVEFLGYQMTMKKMNCNVEPTPKNLHEFKSEFNRKLKKFKGAATSGPPPKKVVDKFKAFVTSWSNAFVLWPNAKQHRDKYIAMIEDAATY